MNSVEKLYPNYNGFQDNILLIVMIKPAYHVFLSACNVRPRIWLNWPTCKCITHLVHNAHVRRLSMPVD